jgi:hypothetical protein
MRIIAHSVKRNNTNITMKFISVSIIFLLPLILIGQNDSLTHKKRYLSFGTPLLITNNYSVNNNRINISPITNPMSAFIPFYIPIEISFHKILSLNKKNTRLGLIVNKTNDSYLNRFNSGSVVRVPTKGSIILLTYYGFEKTFFTKKKFKFNGILDIDLGFIESYYQDKDRLMTRAFICGVDCGVSLSYQICENIFVKSETIIMPYFFSGKEVILIESIPNDEFWVTNIFGGGYTFLKLFSLNLCFNINK